MYLNVHSFFSLRYGTLSIDELLELARHHGVEVMALTDINTTMGIPEFVKKATQAGVKPVAGVEIRNGDELLFIGLAKDNAGFKELNDYITWHNLNKMEFSLNGCSFSHVIMVYPFDLKHPGELKDYEFTGIKPSQVNRLITSDYRNFQDKLLVWQPVTFQNQKGWFLHKSLRAIAHNTLISKLMPGQFAGQDEIMVPETQLKNVFEQYPAIVKNTKRLLEECTISFEFSVNKNKRIFSESARDDKLLLEKLTMDGMIYRYGKDNPEAKERVKHELKIIDKMGFSAYFLIAWDIVRYSMSRGFYHMGRGSGANSVVAYCLKITDVDPIKLNLYFERFLNPRRSSPPDFDIDYSWRDRDEVQNYIFKRYGAEHTALLYSGRTEQGARVDERGAPCL